jgi:hypothetical protein
VLGYTLTFDYRTEATRQYKNAKTNKERIPCNNISRETTFSFKRLRNNLGAQGYGARLEYYMKG